MGTVAAKARGLKRLCIECGIRFYDMNKRPIVCPTCDAEYTGAVVAKAKRAKLEPETVKPVTEIASADETETTEIETDGDMTLDEVAELEEGADQDDDDEAVDLTPLDIDNMDDEDLDNLDAVEEDND